MTFEQLKTFREHIGLTETDGIGIRAANIVVNFGSAVDITVSWEGQVTIKSSITNLSIENLAAYSRAEAFIKALMLPPQLPPLSNR